MEKDEIKKWSERYFKICLALIQRPCFTNYGTSVPVNVRDVISKADRIMAALEEKERSLFEDCGNG